LSRLEGDVSARVRGGRQPRSGSAQTSTAATAKRSTAAKRSTGGQSRTRARSATPRGQTRAKVLEALKDGPKTAGEISEATGVPRASASTTLNKLAKSGDVVKADRGLQAPQLASGRAADGHSWEGHRRGAAGHQCRLGVSVPLVVRSGRLWQASGDARMCFEAAAARRAPNTAPRAARRRLMRGSSPRAPQSPRQVRQGLTIGSG
jgi:hypothetical protein